MSLPATYQSHLKEKIVLTEKVRDFIFELPCYGKNFDYQAGQFVLLKINDLSRAYSIARAPQKGCCRVFLNIEIVPDGRFSPILDKVEIGGEVDIQGPFGYFVMKSEPNKNLVFVATGVGIAPLKAMIETELQKNPERQIKLFFGVRSETDIFYKEIFEKLSADHPNFEFVLTLSQPGENWSGEVGRVTAHLDKTEFDKNTDFYLCGAKPMIDDAKKILLAAGHPEEQIYFEQFHL